MAMLTNGKGDVLILTVGPRGVTVTSHSNDGSSTEVTYPVLNVQGFLSDLTKEWVEVMPAWMKMIVPTYDQGSETGGFLDPTNTPPATSGPPIG